VGAGPFWRPTIGMMSVKVALGCVGAAATLLLGAAGCGASSDGFKQPVAASGSSHGTKQLFIASGGIESGPGSGLWGDMSSGPDGMQLGCVAGRHYAFVFTIRNRSNAAVILKSAHGSDPAPGIIRRVAVQFRLAPPPPTGDVFVSNLRRWSAAPADRDDPGRPQRRGAVELPDAALRWAREWPDAGRRRLALP
jgi:hypothetical protein